LEGDEYGEEVEEETTPTQDNPGVARIEKLQ
jgi:hypothetical protein